MYKLDILMRVVYNMNVDFATGLVSFRVIYSLMLCGLLINSAVHFCHTDVHFINARVHN